MRELILSRMVETSWSLPFPLYPQASMPSSSGPTKWQSSFVRVSTLRWVAG